MILRASHRVWQCCFVALFAQSGYHSRVLSCGMCRFAAGLYKWAVKNSKARPVARHSQQTILWLYRVRVVEILSTYRKRRKTSYQANCDLHTQGVYVVWSRVCDQFGFGSFFRPVRCDSIMHELWAKTLNQRTRFLDSNCVVFNIFIQKTQKSPSSFIAREHTSFRFVLVSVFHRLTFKKKNKSSKIVWQILCAVTRERP